MSYLNGPATTTEFGVVEVGNNIIITDGVISLEQDVGLTANVSFFGVQGTVVFQEDRQVIDRVTPKSGVGIGLSSITDFGPTAEFTITNTGVTRLTAGSGISISGSTGNITVSSTGADIINTVGTSTSYTATSTDEYIGCTTSSSITITLPAGSEGRSYIIKDENGGNPKITVTGSNGEKIDGSNTKRIEVGYSSITVVFRNGAWRII